MKLIPPIAFALLLVFARSSSMLAGGRYFEVSYPPSSEPGQLHLGVTYTIWFPDGRNPLRGVIVHQHGCGSGACQGGATAAYDLHWQALAQKWNCALMGPSYQQEDKQNCRLWCDPRNGSHKTFLRALGELAAKSQHAELDTVPWCLWGHSGGAFWASLMQTIYPERIVAIWFRSGTAFAAWEKGEIPKPDIPDAAYQIPMMCNPGGKERGDPRFDGAWTGAMAMFKAYRAKGAPVGFAPDPRTAHECGDSRYLAIPFFDACLAARLPEPGGADQSLKPMDARQSWFASVLGERADEAASYQGWVDEAIWLPNERVAHAWEEYVKTGAVGDTTPPPSPADVRVVLSPDRAPEITWDATADFESGLRAFVVERDGEAIGQVPQEPLGRFGRPLFQAMSYHDTPEKPLAEMRFVDRTAKTSDRHVYRVVAVNSVGLRSEPAEASDSPAVAEKPDPGRYSTEQFTVQESRGVTVTARDGVRLSVDWYRPRAEGKFPALLVQTPYNNNALGLMNRARWFARRGYAVVLADCRGRFDSGGEWDPFNPLLKTDGYDLVEWLAGQPWCDGKVGTYGGSYLGWTQWWTAVTAPPSLKAMVPEVAPPDGLFNGPYQNGALVAWAIDWASAMSGRTGQVVADGPYGGFANSRYRDYLIYPYLTLNERRGAADGEWFEKWIKQNRSTDDYWKAISYQNDEQYAKVTVPTLNVTGWFDANHPGSPMNYLGMRRHGATPEARHPRLVIGPWQHGFNTRKVGAVDYGADAVVDWDGYVCRFFDYHLKGRANGFADEPPVYLFVMGENRWRVEHDWPLPQTQWTSFYLHSGGNASTLTGDGTLDTTPSAAEPADAYTYDPRNPTPSPYKGGHTEDGAVDTREAAARDDVLVYTTAPLEKPLEVIGPITARLFAMTSARDTDWMVRLVDVSPDGATALLCDGVLRARFRDPERGGAYNPARFSRIEPEEAYEYTIEFWRGTANRFDAGHRIRVEISSSFFPYFLPNLNTGEDNVGLATEPVTARQRVLHDAEHPSHIILPVVDNHSRLP
ncbi:MAG TPA: CocE/NonD family hydrolase [Pirellulales bacterium]|nr:CocE/NonD family hydrolase [Pirellulales bacterium]